MSKPVTIVNTFGNQTGPIPLSQLDANFTAVAGAVNDLGTYSNYLIDSSVTPNIITVTTAAGTSFAYAQGMTLLVKISNTNTSNTVNINVNGQGNQLVRNADGGNGGLIIGSLVVGMLVLMAYDGAVFRLLGPQSTTNPWLGVTSGGNFTIATPVSGIALTVNGAVNITGVIGWNGAIGAPINTGWGTPTGAGVIANYPGATATLVQTSTVVSQLLVLLKLYGTLGA